MVPGYQERGSGRSKSLPRTVSPLWVRVQLPGQVDRAKLWGKLCTVLRFSDIVPRVRTPIADAVAYRSYISKRSDVEYVELVHPWVPRGWGVQIPKKSMLPDAWISNLCRSSNNMSTSVLGCFLAQQPTWNIAENGRVTILYSCGKGFFSGEPAGSRAVNTAFPSLVLDTGAKIQWPRVDDVTHVTWHTYGGRSGETGYSGGRTWAPVAYRINMYKQAKYTTET